MMNGEIGVDSKINQGSTFWFTFSHAKQASQDKAYWSNLPLTGYRVLLYDANQAARLAVQHLLEHWGIDVITLTTISDVHNHVEIAEKSVPFDLIVLGLSRQETQPGLLNGQIESIRNVTPCNIIALVNSAEAKIFADIRSSGINAALSKPVRYGEFHQLLCKMLVPDNALLEYTGSEQRNPVTVVTDDQSHVPPLTKENVSDDTSDASTLPLHDTTILVVEDQETNARLIDIMLQQAGATSVVVSNGQQALDAVTHGSYDVILMDIQMPEMNGVEATRRIRTLDNNNCDIPIFALTANTVQEDQATYLAAGMNDVLVKPVDEELLINMILDAVHPERYADSAMPITNQKLQKTNSHTNPESAVSRTNQKAYINVHHYKSKLAESKKELSREMYKLLVKELPGFQNLINQAFKDGDFAMMDHHAHKLHGATAYCDVPALKDAVESLEISIKKKHSDTTIRAKLKVLNMEIDTIITPVSDTH
jgi:two-component system sensor histidine kinase BarA